MNAKAAANAPLAQVTELMALAMNALNVLALVIVIRAVALGLLNDK